MTETVVKSSPPLSYTQKLSLIAGSATVLYFLPSEAQAADIRYTNTNPVIITFAQAGQTVGWDIDGNDTTDFNLVAGGDFFDQLFIRLTSNNLLGRGFVRDNQNPLDTDQDDIFWLQRDVIVSNTVQGNGGIDYGWGTFGAAAANRTVLALRGGIFFQPDVAPSTQSSGFIGFRFADSNNEIHYGWAEMRVISNTANLGLSSVIINRWAYNAVSCGAVPLNSPCTNPGVFGSAIEVGNTGGGGGGTQVPEPTSPLALLALGAAGVYRWRKERQESE